MADEVGESVTGATQVFTATVDGLVPAPGVATGTKALFDDGTWDTVSAAESVSGTNVITNANLVQVPTQTFKGRTTAGTGNVEDLTATQATAILNPVVGDSGSGGTKGLVPAAAALDAVSNKVLHADGTFRMPVDPSKVFILFEDFVGGISNSASGGLSNGFFSSTCSGTGTTFSVGSTFMTGNTPGIFNVSTGSTSTGRGSGVAGFIKLGDGHLIFKAHVNFSALSDGTDTYTFDVGLHDGGGTSTAPTEGIFFEYDQTSSVNWRTKTTATSTTTVTTSTTAVTAGSTATWQELMFVVNSDNDEVKFYVDDVLVATHTTNISSDVVKPVVRIIKSVGTTSRVANMDYIFVQLVFNTER